MDIITENDFEYKFNHDKTISLVKYIGNKTDIEIPSYLIIDGEEKKITQLALSCFKNNKIIKNVKLNEGLIKIDDKCFMNSELEYINIPDSVLQIGNYCFYNSSLKELNLNKVKKTGCSICKDCTELETVILSKVMEEISEGSFTHCDKLKNLHITPSIKKIYPSALHYTESLDSLFIESDTFALHDDMISLYNKKTQALVSVLQSKTMANYILPDFISSIETDSIFNISVNNICLNDKITKIPIAGISSCNGVVNIVMPNVVEIDENGIDTDVVHLHINKNLTFKHYNSWFPKSEHKVHIFFNGDHNELYENSNVREYCTMHNLNIDYQKDIDELMSLKYDLNAINQIYRGYEKGLNLSIYPTPLDVEHLRILASTFNLQSADYYIWLDSAYMYNCLTKEGRTDDFFITGVKQVLDMIYDKCKNKELEESIFLDFEKIGLDML